jgi:AcrR family transcriptional regulator
MPNKRQKLIPRVRMDLILTAALQLASEPGGWNNLTLVKIASKAHCTHGLVLHHFGSIAALRRKLVKTAISQENFDVLTQALVAGDPEANRMKPLLRQKAFAHTLNKSAA